MEMTTSRGEDLVTPEQAAARLGVSREAVLQLVAREQLTTYRVGRSLRFATDAVGGFLRQHLLLERRPSGCADAGFELRPPSFDGVPGAPTEVAAGGPPRAAA
jgi:excisionase family DNA binding protein